MRFLNGHTIRDAITGLSAAVEARKQTPTGNALNVQIGPGDPISKTWWGCPRRPPPSSASTGTKTWGCSPTTLGDDMAGCAPDADPPTPAGIPADPVRAGRRGPT